MLFGDAGDDTLMGDLGADTLSGGAGADRFVVGQGADLVTDFNFAEGDRLVLDGAAASQHWTVKAATGGALVTFEGGGSVLLAEVDASAANQGWFV